MYQTIEKGTVMDIYDKKCIKPMLIAEQKEPFSSEDYIFELKFDGIRCIAYFDCNSVDLRNKKDVKIGPLFPELNDIYKQVKHKCILDGELIVTVNGKPDFYEIQRRVVLRDRFKIKLSADKLPATFIAYDILYLENKQLTSLPLLERKELLEKTVSENERFALSRYIDEKGIDLYNLVVNQELEGVVAKHKESKYYFDKRTKEWTKFKNLLDDEYVVCGYAFNRDGTNSLFLGQYRNDILIYKGNVSLGVVGQNFKRILKHNKITTPPFTFISHDNITWIEPTLVVSISYMYKTNSGALRQPVLKGFRDDKLPIECIENN